MYRFIPLLTAAALLAACGSSDSSDSTAAPVTAPATVPATTAAPTTAAPTTVAPETLGGELVGRWAHYDVVAYEDGQLKTLIISYGFNDFTEVDGQIIADAGGHSAR